MSPPQMLAVGPRRNRRAAVCLLVIFALVLPAAGESEARPRKRTRTVILTYAAIPSTCPEPDAEGTDCVVFTVRPGERYVEFVVTDDGGTSPGAIPWRDVDGDGEPEYVDENDYFCETSTEPFYVAGATNVGLYIDSVDCVPSLATRGTIEATFKRAD